MKCRPVSVTAPPIGIRFQPDSEGFREILGGVSLCVPFAQMMHISPAAGTRLVTVWVLQGSRSEDFAPPLTTPQPISIVNSVPRLVTQNAHEPARIATLHLSHDVALELFQPGMCK